MNADKQDDDIAVQLVQDFQNITLEMSRLEKLVKNICNMFGVSRAKINIAVVGDTGIVEFNERFLQKRSCTDVISFDLSDEQPGSAKVFDLVVNAEQAVRQSQSRNHSSQSELALYITHGLLHNLGFDDATESQAAKMHEMEDEILQQQGFGLVYNSGLKQ